MHEKRISQILLGFSFLIALIAIIFFPKWLVDDAYIIFRYSENLAEHFQLNWNLNQNPVEGYTGIVLPVIIALAIKIGISPEFTTHTIGIISFLSGGLALYFFLKKVKISDLVCSITILLYFSISVLYTHIYSGLETIFFISTFFFILLISIDLLKAGSLKISQLVLLNIVLLLFSLTRPEGIVLAFLICSMIILYFLSERKTFTKKFLIYLMFYFGIPFTTYFFWRWIYYGQFYPNTFYIKSNGFSFSYGSYNSFLKFVNTYMTIPFIVAFILVAKTLGQFLKQLKENKVDVISKEFLSLFIAVLLFTIIIILKYLHSELLMDFSHRFFIITIPAFLILLAILFDLAYKNLKTIITSNKLFTGLFIILVIILFIFHFDDMFVLYKKEMVTSQRMKDLLEKVHIQTGKYIKKNFDKDLTLLVHADAGAIPYYSKLHTIDFGGLNDEYLSKRDELISKQIIDYFFKVDADILAITSFYSDKIERDGTSLNWNILKVTLKDERFKNYRLVKVFGTTNWKYYEFVLVKNKVIVDNN